MELRYLMQLARAHGRFLVVLTLAAGLVGLLLTYVIPEEYEASTKILIRPQKEVAFESASKAMMDYPVSFNIPVESISQTYAEIMVSEAVATKVVETLHLDTWQPEPDPRWYVRALEWTRDWAMAAAKYTWELARYGRVEQKDPYWAAVEKVQDCLSAEPVEKTYLFELTAAPSNPHLAALIANTAASVFVDYSRKARQGEEGTAAEFVSESLERVRGELAAARARLDDFRKVANAASLDEELSLKLEKMLKFEADLAEARKDLQETDAEIAGLRGRIEEQSAEVHSSTTMEKNPVLQELQRELARDQVELATLESTYTDAHPRVRSLKEKISETRARIDAEASQVRASDTVVINPIHQDLSRRLLERAAQRDSIAARIRALEPTLGGYQGEIDRLAGHKSELARLTLDVRVLEDSYKLVSREYEENRLAAAQAISEIRVLHPAVAPVYPAGPIKVYYAGAGLGTGLLLGIAFLLIGEYVDRRIRTREDLEELLDVPVLATVPRASLPQRFAAILGERGASPATLSWRLLPSETSSKEEAGDDDRG